MSERAPVYGFTAEEIDADADAFLAAVESLEEMRSDVQSVFGSDAGRRILVWLYTYCFQNRTTMVVGNGTVDPYSVVYGEGRRSVYLELLRRLTLDDLDIQEAAREHASRRARSHSH